MRPVLEAHADIGAPLAERFDTIMAIVLQRLDRPAEALVFQERIYRALLARHGPGSAEVGRKLEVYSVLLVDLQRADEAVAQTRLNYEASRHNAKLSLAWQASFASAHAYALLGAHRPAQAEEFYREAMRIKERIFGVDQPGTTISINNVATALCDQGRYAEATQLYGRVLAIRRAHEAPDSLGIATVLASLGETQRRAGDFVPTIAAMRESLALYEKRATRDAASATELQLRENLARVLESQREFTQALNVLVPVVEHVRRKGSAYAGTTGLDARLLQIRLMTQAGSPGADCAAADEALRLAMARAVQIGEARILAADCEYRRGRVDIATKHLADFNASAAELAQLSAYARERLAELRRRLS